MDFAWNRQGMRRLARALPLAVLIAVALAAGCKHRRSAYRPAFVDPEPVLIEPTPSTKAIIPTDPSPYADELDDAVPETTPGFDDAYGPYVSPPAGVYPDDEPELEPVDPVAPAEPAAPLDGQTLPSRVDPDPPLVSPPQTRREPSSGRDPMARRTALRNQVQQLADDPMDLVQPPKADRRWRYIVLHHSARPDGGYAQLDRDHRERGGLDGCGYHFVIGNGTGSPDGTIEVTRRWSEQRPGAHCRDVRSPAVNEYGIGICLVGNLDDGEPTPRQVAAARALVAYLGDRYAIPGARIGTHAELAATPTVCPGDKFPGQQIIGRASLASR